MKNYLKKFFTLIRDFKLYFYKGYQSHLLKPYIKAFIHYLILYLNHFRHALYFVGVQNVNIHEENIKKLRQTSQGLYSFFSVDIRFFYSVLLPVINPRLHCFQRCLESILNQSVPSVEILIGLMDASVEIDTFLLSLQKRYPHQIHIFHFASKLQEEVINQLAQSASGHFLFIMGQEDWLRPDLLFRYEQTLRILPFPEKSVLYCNVNEINEKDCFLPLSEHHQPNQICFPFFFKQFTEQGLLIPTALWRKIQGLHVHFRGAIYENLLLQLDLVGAIFQHIPLCLYSLCTPVTHKSKAKSQTAFLQVLENYTHTKKLDWKWLPGYQSNTVRAQPPINPKHWIQVIIPYKDQKDLTLKCIQNVLKQENVQLKITAIDNCSTDRSIGEAIRLLGGEVIFVDEPFNYSRLNNLAVHQTKIGSDCSILLFLNNDVELESDALNEMVRWIDQPQIGMIGCRLHYPDGRLQHGGVRLEERHKREMHWEHIEKFRSFEEMNETKVLGFFDAVTAACAMMKKEVFLAVGGFDEVWYPIGFSDTNLAVKLSAIGLKCFYTPYAKGIHYESISRKTSIEDYESSWWLHQLLIEHQKMKAPCTTFQHSFKLNKK